MAKGCSKGFAWFDGLCWSWETAGRFVSSISLLQVFGDGFVFKSHILLLSTWVFVGLNVRPPPTQKKELIIILDLRIGPLIFSLCLNFGSKMYFWTKLSHKHATPKLKSLLLDFIIDVPDVSHHGVGTSLQVPSGQGQLGAQLLLVAGHGDGC